VLYIQFQGLATLNPSAQLDPTGSFRGSYRIPSGFLQRSFSARHPTTTLRLCCCLIDTLKTIGMKFYATSTADVDKINDLLSLADYVFLKI